MMDHQVAIVGGGMVGATLACALARGGIDVVILDRQVPPRTWPEGLADLRVSALSHASQQILQTLGVWQGMVDRAVAPYRWMRVEDAGYGGELLFDGADVGEDIMGHIVENRVTVAALWDQLDQLPNVTVEAPSQVTGLQCGADSATLLLAGNRRLTAELVVAADGKASAIRQLAGIPVTGWSYQHSALVATVKPAQWHQETAWQRFLAGGVLAFLPLNDGYCSIVWSTAPETSKKLMAMDDPTFLRALEEASNGILGAMEAVGERGAFPLTMQHAQRYTEQQVVLVGDAAHAMHPLAGQGVNMGLLDAAALAEQVILADQQQRPIASRQTLRRYERWRKSDNLEMLASMELLKRLYGTPSTAVGRLRSGGMDRVNSLQPLKNFFIRHAMGIRDDLPRLAYGQPCWSV